MGGKTPELLPLSCKPVAVGPKKHPLPGPPLPLFFASGDGLIGCRFPDQDFYSEQNFLEGRAGAFLGGVAASTRRGHASFILKGARPGNYKSQPISPAILQEGLALTPTWLSPSSLEQSLSLAHGEVTPFPSDGEAPIPYRGRLRDKISGQGPAHELTLTFWQTVGCRGLPVSPGLPVGIDSGSSWHRIRAY